MSNFVLGIGVNIPNHSFNYPTYFSNTIANANVAAGATSFYISSVYPTSAELQPYNYMKRGDIIVLTSSSPSYSGYTEHAEIVSCVQTGPDFVVTVKDALSYAYLIGDTVSGYGSGFPDGWLQRITTPESLFATTIKPHDGGYGDNYAFYGYANKNGATGGVENWVSLRDFDVDPWLEYCRYRVGCWTKCKLSGSGAYCAIRAYDGISTKQISWSAPTADNTWEEKTYSFISGSNLQSSTRTRTGNVSFHAYASADTDASTWFYVDDVYLEHIRGVAPVTQAIHNFTVSGLSLTPILVDTASDFTVGSTVYVWGYNSSGSIIYSQGSVNSISGNYLYVVGLDSGSYASGCRVEQTNNGYYELEEYPDQGVEWERVSTIVKNRSINNTLKLANIAGWGERTSKINIKMNFSVVSDTFYKKMKVFEDACASGSYTNLHGLSTQLPEIGTDFLQCNLTLSNFRHDIWDRTKVSFSATFEQI
jgi:hypothetical protein